MNRVPISNRRWERVRDRFDEDDKSRLLAAKVGEIISPRGVVLDLDQIQPELRSRLEEALR